VAGVHMLSCTWFWRPDADAWLPCCAFCIRQYAALDALCSEHCYWVLCGEPWLPEGAEDDDKEAAAAAEGPLYF
jgi:hypothetical protein